MGQTSCERRAGSFLFTLMSCLEKIQVEAKNNPVSEATGVNSNDETGNQREESMPDDTQVG